MTVITLSRQLGSHGEEIAAAVAERLDLRLVDANAINQAAQTAGVPEVALAELEREAGRGLANQVLKALRAMPSLQSMAPAAPTLADEVSRDDAELAGLTIPFAGIFSPAARPISASMDSYVRMVGMVVRGLARLGNVLIMGRGGQILLRNYPGTLHVQIVAPEAYRVEVLVERLKGNKRLAQSRLRASDRGRADYLRRYHNADWLDPTLYHLAINTGRVSVATAIDLIIAAQRAQQQPEQG